MQFESSYYLTLVWKLPSERQTRVGNVFYRDDEASEDSGAFDRDLADFGHQATTFIASSEREDELLKKIGELTVERDFLSRGLERRR